MQKFIQYTPTEILFGENTQAEVGKEVKKWGGSRVFIVYGGGSVKKSGLLAQVEEALEKEGLAYEEFGGVKPNPRMAYAQEGVEKAIEFGADFLLAVGGGSAIDTAKGIAIGAANPGTDIWEFWKNKKELKKALPVGTVLTISAAGSEMSNSSVITKEEGMFKRGATGEAFRPKFTIMNPALTQTLPAYQTACGITDIMAHLYERYLTNTEEVEVTDRMIEGLLLTMIHEGPRVIADPDNYQARANIMWAGMMAHNNSCGVGRTQDWTSHNIEHELSALYDCAHGAGLAVVMPAVFTYTLEHNVMRFAQAAVRVWGCQMDFADPKRTALEGIEALRNFLISIGMPKNFAELGAKEEDIEKLAHTCCYGDVNTGTVEGFATLDQKDVENIYKLMVF